MILFIILFAIVLLDLTPLEKSQSNPSIFAITELGFGQLSECFWQCFFIWISFHNQTEQMERDQLRLNFEVYVQQVSGKEPKLLSDDHTKLLKGLNPIQRDFYLQILSYHISHPFAAMQRHIPQFYGVMELHSDPSISLSQENHEKSTLIWLNHLTGRYKVRNDSNKFIILQNLTYGWQLPNIFDIKIGGRNVEGKKHKITKSVSQFFVKLNGCKMHFTAEENQSIFLSKYYLAEAVQYDKILEYLRLFFFDGFQVHLKTIRCIRDKLQDLILSFKALRGYKFISSSLCIIYDAKNPLVSDIKLLDFGRVAHCSSNYVDEDSLSGLINIHRFLSILLEMEQKDVNLLEERRKFYCKADITIVPEKKKIKYHENGEQNPTKI